MEANLRMLYTGRQNIKLMRGEFVDRMHSHDSGFNALTRTFGAGLADPNMQLGWHWKLGRKLNG